MSDRRQTLGAQGHKCESCGASGACCIEPAVQYLKNHEDEEEEAMVQFEALGRDFVTAMLATFTGQDDSVDNQLFLSFLLGWAAAKGQPMTEIELDMSTMMKGLQALSMKHENMPLSMRRQLGLN